MIHEDSRSGRRGENNNDREDVFAKLQASEAELNITKEHLRRIKSEYEINQHTVELQEKQIRNQNRRHREIEKVHRELIEEYENQVSSMKEEIRRMKYSQEKLLKKFKSLNTPPTTENSTKVLDAICDLEKLIRNNEIKSVNSSEKEILGKDVDETLENCLRSFEKELQEIITKEETSADEIDGFEVKLKNQLDTVHKFVNNVERIQKTLRSWKKQNTQEMNENYKDIEILPIETKVDNENVEDSTLYLTMPTINWNEIMDSEVSFKDSIIEDQLINEFHERIGLHLQKLETLVLELCHKDKNTQLKEL